MTALPTDRPTGAPGRAARTASHRTDPLLGRRDRDDTLAWEIELDRLELDLMRVERLLRAASPLEEDGWEPPTGLGPMPAHLLPRAREIAARQQAAEVALQRAARRTGREAAFAENLVGLAEGAERPRFLDIDA